MLLRIDGRNYYARELKRDDAVCVSAHVDALDEVGEVLTITVMSRGAMTNLSPVVIGPGTKEATP